MLTQKLPMLLQTNKNNMARPTRTKIRAEQRAQQDPEDREDREIIHCSHSRRRFLGHPHVDPALRRHEEGHQRPASGGRPLEDKSSKLEDA